jgi:hypothetical protein
MTDGEEREFEPNACPGFVMRSDNTMKVSPAAKSV